MRSTLTLSPFFLFIADHSNALAFLVKSIGLGINFILALNFSFNLFVLSMVMYYNAFQTKKKENLKYKHIIETHNIDVLMDIF